jgi:N-acetylglucosamine kinase-like BadF-type ATPase
MTIFAELDGPACALGFDAGGTGTRFCLMREDGRVLVEGTGRPLSGLMLSDGPGLADVDVVLGAIARALPVLPRAVVGGISGYDAAHASRLLPRLTQIFGVSPDAAAAMCDIELHARTAFPSGDGIVVYAGTGSAAALLDIAGELHRTGGRGTMIDDAGGGDWIAREALRRVWRAEDEEPGSWQRSPLAHALFAVIGGHEWPATRSWVYGRGARARGRLGELSLAVAGAANKDAAAMALLEQAGRELARLVLALLRRHGKHPVALAGRVFELHPAIERALVAALPTGTEVNIVRDVPHQAAARMALRLMPPHEEAHDEAHDEA